MAQTFAHYSLHLLFPGLIAWLFFRKKWQLAWLILLATMLVDLDHLFAYPDVFVPDRCGIGFHPLHSWWAIAVYVALLVPQATRLVALGLLMHMATDLQDCWWMEQKRDSAALGGKLAADHCPSSTASLIQPKAAVLASPSYSSQESTNGRH